MIDPTKLMRGVFLALALLLAAPLTGIGGSIFGVEAAQAQTVRKIDVIGNSKVDDSTVVNYLAVRVGDVATSPKINASIEALVATGLFKTVSVGMQGSTLVVKVSENGIVASVLFEGNQRFSDANLLAMVDIAAQGSFSDERLQRDIDSIKLAYTNAGYSAVTVTARTEAVADGRTRVTFVINEGVRAGIAAINFTGNNTINAWALKSIIKTHETNFLSWLLRDDTYTQAQLDNDRELIRRYYGDHGYPDAQVTSAVAEYDASRNGYFINFTIIEGDRYQFGKIAIETSIAGLNADELTGTIRTQQGSRYSTRDLLRTQQDMAYEATSQGYPFADVRPRIDRDPATGALNITYLVDEGQRVYVERINITGNDKTRDFVIRRELDFAEGDPFNRSMVSRGKTAIEALDFFDSVDVTMEPGSAPDKVIINIAVVEKSTGDYGVTAGYDTQKGILGEISLTEKNFLGRGQYLRAALGASLNGQTFDFSFTEPRFMGLKLSAGVDAYYHIDGETSSNYFGVTAVGGQVRLGLPITRDLTASVFTGVEQKTLTDKIVPNTTIFGGANADGFVSNKAWVGYGLTYNGLDDLKHPTEGFYATLNQQYVGWDHNFIKTELKARYFMPLMEDLGLVGSVRGQVGVINNLGAGGVSPLESFNLGPSLVRGFSQMGPRFNGQLLGSTMYAGASAEMTFPIPMLPETYGLTGAVWADAAVISGQGTTLVADPLSVDQSLKSSVGASIIWDSPFGPLRGDFAYVITKATADQTQIFQLTLQNLL